MNKDSTLRQTHVKIIASDPNFYKFEIQIATSASQVASFAPPRKNFEKYSL